MGIMLAHACFEKSLGHTTFSTRQCSHHCSCISSYLVHISCRDLFKVFVDRDGQVSQQPQEPWSCMRMCRPTVFLLLCVALSLEHTCPQLDCGLNFFNPPRDRNLSSTLVRTAPMGSSSISANSWFPIALQSRHRIYFGAPALHG